LGGEHGRRVLSAGRRFARGDAVTGVEHTVAELIARYALRRHASSAEFMAGLWLVRRGAVRLQSMSSRALRAVVSDGASQTVSIVAEGDHLVGDCSCGSAAAQVCRHQVAAAHVVWLQSSAQYN
jgi:uncharacterized Zn finger protein